MAVLYVTGDQRRAGKTALATALASLLLQRGRVVALLKPIHMGDPNQGLDRDALFYPQVAPANPSPQGWPRAIAPQALQNHQEAVKYATDLVGATKAQVVMVEGLDSLRPEDPQTQTSARLAHTLNAQVVATVRYTPALTPESLADQGFGPSLRGLIVNQVPRYRLQDAQNHLLPALRAQGLPALGAIPEDRSMLAPTVQELAEHLGGEFFLPNGQEHHLVESVMVGGFFLDPGDYVFSRRERKAVLVRGDRPDLQMAALKTSTACLVLTGGHLPIQYVVYEAEQQGVPIILVKSPTLEAMERLHTLDQRVTVHHPRKVARFQELLAQHCNLPALLAELGLG